MMIWLRLFWWMVWRGAVSGAACGALFGAILALALGAVFGFVYGLILGLATGAVNGFAVAIITRVWFYPPPNAPRYRKAMVTTVVMSTAITGLLLMGSLMSGVTFFVIVPTVIATVVSGLMARRFPAYVENEFWEHEHPEKRSPRKAQIVW